jgi:hypothetical protein
MAGLLLGGSLVPFPRSAEGQPSLIITCGLVVASTASVNIVNSTAQGKLFYWTIPAALMATISQSNSAIPLHLAMHGLISTASSSTVINLGVNWGPGGTTSTPSNQTATVALVNAVALDASMARRPIALDVWVSPIATTNFAPTFATPTLAPAGFTSFLTARLAYESGTGGFATESVFNAASLAQTNTLVPQKLSVWWGWQAASSSNSVEIYRATLQLCE